MSGDQETRNALLSASTTGWRRRVTQWVLLGGDRAVVAVAIAGVFLAAFGALVRSTAVPLSDLQSVYYVYSGLITGNVTLVTVVVSINQLLLSRELQTPGELRTQIENVIDFRRDVEEATDEIAPVEPDGFLRLLVEATREEAQRLGGLSRDDAVTDGGSEIREEVRTLTEGMDDVDSLLRKSDEDTVEVLSVLLETNYAAEIHALRRLKAEYRDGLTAPVRDSIDDIIDRLQEIDVARQYFKSIYLQQELSRLSRILLYVGLPAIGVAAATLLVLSVPTNEPGGVHRLSVLLPVSLSIGLLPISVLCSYILRMATVTKLTAATLPFTTPEQER